MKFFPFKLPTTLGLLSDVSFRNKGHLMQIILSKIWLALGGHTNPSVIRSTSHIVKKLLLIKQAQGKRGLTLYLKVCSILMQQSLGGHIVHDLTVFNTRISRTKSNVPTILPVLWRSNLRNRPMLVRYILSIFAIYRFLIFDSPVKIDAITAPFKGDKIFLDSLSGYIPDFFSVISIYNPDYRFHQEKLTIEPCSILTKGPTTFKEEGVTTDIFSSHSLSVLRSIFLLNLPEHEVTKNALIKVISYFNYRSGAQSLISRISSFTFIKTSLYDAVFSWNLLSFLPNFSEGRKAAQWREDVIIKENTPLGKLGLKQEPAGKMRVFAMVDPLTQWALKPLHNFIFESILSKIPMDGTFAQTEPLKKSKDWSVLYSLDLSSATDRLPISLQADIINYLYPGLGEPWKDLLVSRSYKVPKGPIVKYSVGQPMGAYSSWALLALTHHFIIQVAAWQAGVVQRGYPFTAYAVLGDDVVIGNKAVAKRYLQIISLIGVECGLHKSLLSPAGTALEFAKRTWFYGTDVSPISIRELASALVSIQNLVAFGVSHNLQLPSIVKIAGFGYKVLGGLNKPFVKLNEVVRNLIISMILPSSPTEISQLFGRTSFALWTWNDKLNSAFVQFLISLYQDIRLELPSIAKLMKDSPEAQGDVNFAYNYAKADHLRSKLIFNLDQTIKRLKTENLLDFNSNIKLELNPESLKYFNPLNQIDILVEFKNYIDLLSLYISYKTIFIVKVDQVKFGLDPKQVKIWKLWAKVIPRITKVITKSA